MSQNEHQSSPVSQGPYARELATAIRLVREAGEIVRTFYDVPARVQWKTAAEPVTEADHASNAYLIRGLAAAFPGDGILAEESSDDLSRLEKQRVWLVDPLDGTMEFIAHNGQFSVMVALADAGRPVVGAVYQPEGDLVLAAATGSGAFLEQMGERHMLHVSVADDLAKLRPVVSRSHRPPLLDQFLKALGVQKEREMGSIGLKIALLAQAQADFYLHPSPGPKEWDTCAPEVILREAGGMMTDCWNRPLRYNQRDIRRPFGILATNGSCHEILAGEVGRLLDRAGLDPEFGF